MSYGSVPYAGGAYAGESVAAGANNAEPILSVEVAFTTGALEAPVWVDVTADVRRWNVSRGRRRELERFQPGRATIVLDNRSRDYDSSYTGSPHNGNIKPMRRIRIRETFNGVTYPTFDGFVDKWLLDYPVTGKDATATVTATDAFKIFARTDLRRSVYYLTVLGDNPDIYWLLDESLLQASDANLVALNAGTLGTIGDGTYDLPIRMGDKNLVVLDPGGSIFTNQDTLGDSVFLKMGVTIDSADFDLFGEAPWAFEAWTLPIEDPPGTVLDDATLMFNGAAGGGAGNENAIVQYDVSAGTFVFSVVNTVPTAFTATSAVAPRNERHHVVARFVSGEPARLWVDGVLTSSGTTSGSFPDLASGDTFVGHIGTEPGNLNWVGNISHVAMYTGTNASAVDQTWVDRHYAAGTAPWNGDQPDDRADRVLDINEWPASLREIDDGNVSLQSASIAGQTVLEHLQKIAETEFALLFASRDGKVRLVDRAAQFARTPDPAVLGDADNGDEVPYRDIEFDDGDSVIRNRATISRLNGVARVSESTASVDEFGRFDYTLDGLPHSAEAHSSSYADFIVAEYKDPRRRVVSLDLGPAKADAGVYEQMLGRELGDAITVRNRPLPAGSTAFEQTCVIEGIYHDWQPKVRTARWSLSPEFSTSF